MRVILVEPGKRARPAEIEEGLQAMQELVGGTLQALYPWRDKAAIVCNDEGRLIQLPLNRVVAGCGVIAGTFFVCGIHGKDFCSLTERQMEAYRQMFHDPEAFVRTPDGLMYIRLRRVAGPEKKPQNHSDQER